MKLVVEVVRLVDWASQEQGVFLLVVVRALAVALGFPEKVTDLAVLQWALYGGQESLFLNGDSQGRKGIACCHSFLA